MADLFAHAWLTLMQDSHRVLTVLTALKWPGNTDGCEMHDGETSLWLSCCGCVYENQHSVCFLFILAKSCKSWQKTLCGVHDLITFKTLQIKEIRLRTHSDVFFFVGSFRSTLLAVSHTEANGLRVCFSFHTLSWSVFALCWQMSQQENKNLPSYLF